MIEARIQAAYVDHVFILKLTGDVRLTLCATLDQQARALSELRDLKDVIIDLREVINLDSTSLGFLAKIALAVKARIDRQPVVIASHPDVLRMFDVMGFRHYVSLSEAPPEQQEFHDLPVVDTDEAGLRERILDAHRTLMTLNERNKSEFQPLVDLLELQRFDADPPS
ncbi:STAS domain-containing protein [Larsenimonas salina]|uniref:STAS domain-containing protein n=1 Tax=Larsenimonas salina TaxID=1295565 RepID=UPI002072B01F|nr:STAS domain-containing protein [Larsenimonas salina]MCM5705758.1 STAS domain-containing protein [Larsenimonas salina]